MLALSLAPALIGALVVVPMRAMIGLSAGWLALVAGLMLVEWVRVNRLSRCLHLEARASASVFSAKPFALQLRVWADMNFPLCKVMLRLDIPEGVRLAQESVGVMLSPQAPYAEHVVQVLPVSRGKVCFERACIRILTQRALCSFQCEVLLATALEVTVFPNSNFAAQNVTLVSRGLGERLLDSGGGEGREFDSLRSYAVGDDLRRVDWKRSARGTGLQVRVYRPETHQRVSIALDCSRRMATRLGDRLLLDVAADAAAYLTLVASGNDDEVGLFAFNHEVLCRHDSRRGKRQEAMIMKELLRLQPGSLEGDYGLITEWARFNRRRSLFVVITSVSSPASLETLFKTLRPLTKRHLPLVMAIADRDLQRLAGEKAQDLDDAYVIASAVEQLQAIEARVHWLERAGIECVYCDAQDLGARLHEKYLKLKVSGRL